MAKANTTESIRRKYSAQAKIVTRYKNKYDRARKTLDEVAAPLRAAEATLAHIESSPVFDDHGNLITVDFSDLKTAVEAEVAAEDAEQNVVVEDAAQPQDEFTFA